MADQAEALRRVSPPGSPWAGLGGSTAGRQIAIVSGKGGVGKSVFAANLALALALDGSRPLLVDANDRMGHLDLLIGLSAAEARRAPMGRVAGVGIVLQEPEMGFLPAAQFAPRARRWGEGWQNAAAEYGVILYDTITGPAPTTLSVVSHCREVFLVTTPQATAIADSYAMAKILWQNDAELEILLLVNRAAGVEHARQVLEKVNLVTERFLGRRVAWGGYLPADPVVDQAIDLEVPIYTSFQEAPFAKAVGTIAAGLLEKSMRKAS